MWLLAVIAGMALLCAVGYLAKRVFRAGRGTLGRLIEMARWPLWFAAISVAIGLARHETAWILTWQAMATIGGGLAGQVTYLLSKATFRTYRILRQRRNRATAMTELRANRRQRNPGMGTVTAPTRSSSAASPRAEVAAVEGAPRGLATESPWRSRRRRTPGRCRCRPAGAG